MFLRKIGKLLRGKATPFQIISASVICGLLGSIPGLTQGPLLLISLLFLLIVLNANLFIGALTLILVKLLTLLLLPVCFKLGVFLLENGLGGPISVLVNAPVTAWFGLDYYVMVPSLIIGGTTGLIMGILITNGLKSFRSKMADMETGSARYQQYSSKLWVRALAWLTVGGLKGKKSWSELSESKKGLPIRPIGVVFVISLAVLGFVGLKFLDSTIVTTTVRTNLEKANGATVDLETVEILAGENRIVINGLAMADPEQLDTNRFVSQQIVADLSGMSLLSKRVVIDSLRIVEPKSGTSRRIPGRKLASIPEPAKVEKESGEIDIDGYIGQASVWRERLRTIKRVYDRLAPYLEKDSPEDTDEDATLTWKEQLALQAKEKGYARVKAPSLVRGSPSFWIRNLEADNLIIAGSNKRFQITGSNLSGQPALLDESGILSINQIGGGLSLELSLPSSSEPAQSGLKVSYTGLPVAELENEIGRDLPMNGGTIDLSGVGTINSGLLNLPLTVTLNDTTLNAFGSSVPLDNFPIQVAVYGPLDRPSLKIPEDAIKEAVLAGGKKKLQNMIEEEAGDKLKGLFKF